MKIIIYLSLDPQKAKEDNLPISLPLLEEDFEIAANKNKLDPDMILRGLKAQVETGKKLDYYLPYLVYFLYDRARFYINYQDLNQARQFVEEAKNYKKDYRYPLHLGIIERLSGNFEQSEILLKEAITMNTDYVPTRIELVRTLMAQSEFEDAIIACKDILEIDPAFTLTYVLMGDAYLSLGDAKSAIALYQQASFIDHDLQSIHWRIGVAANTLQRFSLAENEFKTSISKGEQGWHIRYDLSYSLYRNGKIFEALRLLEELQKSGVEAPEVMTEMLILQKIAGLYEEGLKTVKKGMEMQIREEGFLLASIDIYAFNGMKKEAFELANTLPSELSDPRKKLIEIEDEWNLEIDLLELSNLIALGKNRIKNKIEDVRNGFVNENKAFDISMLSIVEKVIDLHGIHFYSAESILTRSSMAFSGSIETVALFIFLYRIYFYTHALDYTLEDSLDSVIPQIADISWKTGQEIAQIVESEKLSDLESMVKKLKKPIDVTKFLTSIFITLKNEKNISQFLRSIDTPDILTKISEKILNGTINH